MALTNFHMLAEAVGQLSGGGTHSFVTSPVRTFSRGSLRCNPTTTATGFSTYGTYGPTSAAHLSISGSVGYWTFYFRYATKPAANSEIFCQLVSGTTTHKSALRLNSSGNIEYYDAASTLIGTGSTVLAADTWYRISIRYSQGVDLYEIFVAAETDDFGAAELTGDMDHGASPATRIRLGKTSNSNSQTVDFFYADLSHDTTDPRDNYYIASALTTGAGSVSGWTGSEDDVDEFPNDGDTTVISTSTNAAESLFTMDESAALGIGSSDTIHAVNSIVTCRGTTANNEVFRVSLRSGGTTVRSGNTNLPTTHSTNGWFRTTDPLDSAAWTPAKFDTIECGCQLGSTNEVFATTVQAWVMFTPAAGGAVAPFFNAKILEDPFGMRGFFGI